MESSPKELATNFTILYILGIINQVLRLNGEDIKRSSDFCYLGSVVAEDGGASTDLM
jgi:hypothetical protein